MTRLQKRIAAVVAVALLIIYIGVNTRRNGDDRDPHVEA